jgi:hypothetical protein
LPENDDVLIRGPPSLHSRMALEMEAVSPLRRASTMRNFLTDDSSETPLSVRLVADLPPIDGACCDDARPMALPEVDSRELRPRTAGGVAAASDCWETADAGFTPSGEEEWGEWAPSSAGESSSGAAAATATAGLRRRRDRVDFVRRCELGVAELAGDVESDTKCGCRMARADGGASLLSEPERGEDVDDFRPYLGRHRERVGEAASYLSPASDMAAARVVVSLSRAGAAVREQRDGEAIRRGFVGVARGGGGLSNWQQGTE